MAGVDGCPGGWVAALVEDRGDAPHLVGLRRLERAVELADLADRVAIDIPIGLPERGRRALEREVRALLPGRGSTVFPTPVRAVLAQAPPDGDYARACALSRERCGGLAISRQTWLLTDKIAEVDAALAAHPGLDDRVAEAHPELAFATMDDGRPLPAKKSAEGRRRRETLLAAWLPGLRLPPAAGLGARPDDLLDALACAWVALRWSRGTATAHHDPSATHDTTGRPMRIVC